MTDKNVTSQQSPDAAGVPVGTSLRLERKLRIFFLTPALTLVIFVMLSLFRSRDIWLIVSLLVVLAAFGFVLQRAVFLTKTLRGQVAEEQARLGQAIQSAEAECRAQRLAATTARDFAECLLQNVPSPVLVMDAAGRMVSANPAAQTSLGAEVVQTGESTAEWAARHRLQYPSGQSVPPGAVPLSRTILDCQPAERSEFLLSLGQETRIVELAGVPLLSAEKNSCVGAFALLNDITDLRHSRAQEAVVQSQIVALARISGLLAAAASNKQVSEVVAEGALALLPPNSGAARAVVFGLEDKRLLLLSEAPLRRPRRPRTQQQAQTPCWPFDAQSPLLWQLYVGRQPVVSADVTKDERFDDQTVRPLMFLPEGHLVKSLLAVPMMTGKHVKGHLVVTSPHPGVFSATSLQDALASLAASATLARANVSLGSQALRHVAEREALWAVSQTLASGKDKSNFPTAFAEQVRTILEADVCTVSLWESASEGEGRLRSQVSVPEDALLPGQTLIHSPVGCSVCDHLSQQTVRGEAVMRTGIPNPTFGNCRWHVFAGQSGVHSVLTSPIRRDGKVLGVLALYRSGETLFTPSQIHLLETFALLFAASLSHSVE